MVNRAECKPAGSGGRHNWKRIPAPCISDWLPLRSKPQLPHLLDSIIPVQAALLICESCIHGYRRPTARDLSVPGSWPPSPPPAPLPPPLNCRAPLALASHPTRWQRRGGGTASTLLGCGVSWASGAGSKCLCQGPQIRGLHSLLFLLLPLCPCPTQSSILAWETP